ncbi:hypothetical protein [Streptomyces sp. NBC_01180]|uniref:hypothetical protein n=1 Tax=Streptomyces sp. NBC_01180 TaxID=2903763 RepID=UPI003866AEEC|nr:hypothetical protein OG708_33985 [Streptomyces sp. NBC_01180]
MILVVVQVAALTHGPEVGRVAVLRHVVEGVAGVEEGVARLQLWAQVGLAGLLSEKILRHPATVSASNLPFEFLSTGRHPRIPDLDLGADERLGDEEFGMAGRLRKVTHDPRACQKTVV